MDPWDVHPWTYACFETQNAEFQWHDWILKSSIPSQNCHIFCHSCHASFVTLQLSSQGKKEFSSTIVTSHKTCTLWTWRLWMQINWWGWEAPTCQFCRHLRFTNWVSYRFLLFTPAILANGKCACNKRGVVFMLTSGLLLVSSLANSQLASVLSHFDCQKSSINIAFVQLSKVSELHHFDPFCQFCLCTFALFEGPWALATLSTSAQSQPSDSSNWLFACLFNNGTLSGNV